MVALVALGLAVVLVTLDLVALAVLFLMLAVVVFCFRAGFLRLTARAEGEV